jgi:hypothetical protein
MTSDVEIAPIAVILSAESPVAYMPSNPSSVIEGDSYDSESSVSPIVASLAPSLARIKDCEIAPLTMPHLFWECTMSGPATEFPSTVKALIDHGSHAVLISSETVSFLGLKRGKLHKTMIVETAIPNANQKQIICMKEWVKLSVTDISVPHLVTTPSDRTGDGALP